MSKVLKDIPTIVKAKKLHPSAQLPTYAKDGDAGADLYASQWQTIHARGREAVHTEIALQIPPGFYGRVASRSGNSFKRGLEVGAGTVDSGYRGEILVLIYNHTDEDVVIERGERIGQVIISPCEQAIIEEVQVLDESARGTTGFGSSGK